MSISLELIKDLRERTGAGMADCKSILEEAAGDIEKAIELLRKKGIAKAAKRSDRETSEGLIKLATNQDQTAGFIFEINAETDFVVRSDKFQEYADKLLAFIVDKSPATLAELLSLPFEKGSVQEDLEAFSSVLGEKLEIKRYEKIVSQGTVGAYSHAGGRIGALVALDKSGQSELAREIAMQVAAANPRFIAPEDVTPSEIAQEKDIYTEQLLKEGKPADMIEKIMAGKINKFYEEVCLVKQEYIKDDTKKISSLLGEIKVEKMIRFSL